MKTVIKIFVLIISLPLLCSILIKPAQTVNVSTKNDKSVINDKFCVTVHEKRGDFCYTPEEIVELMTAAQIPSDIVFLESEDYVELSSQTAYDAEQEYLKALSVVLRTNLIFVWEREGCPETLDFGCTGLVLRKLWADKEKDAYIKKKEIERAVAATNGVVITKENSVIAAPFFTSSESDLLINQAGEGEGFSLNYAYRLAKDNLDFYKILQSFYDGISVVIYE